MSEQCRGREGQLALLWLPGGMTHLREIVAANARLAATGVWHVGEQPEKTLPACGDGRAVEGVVVHTNG